ncbi:hypothetical protein FA10DRAFT_263704 [Acaromyces ingoldii]|uniref:Uncharacterized protein n=1 Tax=Acaromyces ingoldii TaxID=215250 RepID=A0A316YUM8_9BASI|nr:hypothetical protein FA10DRAFT_263704 [Acaromyces ingoldii]PWN92979.1 hypothetical protein FA10DRAFT_263704 [Acaromyces ingoldii]
MLATLLSRQTVRKEVPRTVRKRGRRMFSLRRASRVLSTGAAGCDNKQGPHQEPQEDSAATGDNRPPTSSINNEEASDPLSIHPEQQLQHRHGHQHGDGAEPDGISEPKSKPKPKPDREPEREQNHDQDQEPRQSSADRSLYHRSSIIGS